MVERIKAGLEIHQQLDTKKLFCSCPSLLRQDSPLFLIERELNPVVGETGEIDVAARHEKLKEKKFVYEVYDTNCLVELDEEPPHAINEEALRIVLQIAVLLNCKIFPVTQIMRKTVIDGSNTSGFQRSVLIAHDGFIETSQGKVGIETIALEEDAARIVSHEKDKTIYNLDRLGIPLVEITTKPELYSAEQTREAALKIGEIIRACKVKRGIGTIRQDLNISIEGGNRVEIKGFQEPRIMIQTVLLEVQRQKKLIEIHNEIKKMKKQKAEIEDVSDIFRHTECSIVKKALEQKGKVYAAKLSGFAGLLGRELYEGKRFGSEISNYGKMYGVLGLIHSDENLDKYKFSERELSDLKRRLTIGDKDAFIMIADAEDKARKAMEAAIKRALIEIEIAVPKEVRKVSETGTTDYLRPMPGSARMYPETDLQLLKISRDLINEVKKNLPKLKHELQGYLKEYGLNEELIRLILDENKFEEFKSLLGYSDNANLVAKALVLFPKEFSSKYKKSEEEIEKLLSVDILSDILSKVGKDLTETDVKPILQKIVEGKSLEEAMKKESVNLEAEIQSLIKEKPGLSANAYMGLIMAKFKGNVSGIEVMNLLKKFVK